MLQELGIPDEVAFVDIRKGEQFEPAFLAISPDKRIPVVVDDGRGGTPSIFESGTIPTCLADECGRFLAPAGTALWRAQGWLYWQVGGLGPTPGQAGFFAEFSVDRVPLAIDRFAREVGRLLGVLERRLAEAPCLAGEDRSVADIACRPWVAGAKALMNDVLAEHLAGKPAIDRWLGTLAGRPGVRRGMSVAPNTVEPARRSAARGTIFGHQEIHDAREDDQDPGPGPPHHHRAEPGARGDPRRRPRDRRHAGDADPPRGGLSGGALRPAQRRRHGSAEPLRDGDPLPLQGRCVLFQHAGRRGARGRRGVDLRSAA